MTTWWQIIDVGCGFRAHLVLPSHTSLTWPALFDTKAAAEAFAAAHPPPWCEMLHALGALDAWLCSQPLETWNPTTRRKESSRFDDDDDDV